MPPTSTRPIQTLASIPNASYLEYMDWNDDLWIDPIKPSNTGTMAPPERPGHGLAFRPEVLKDHKIGESRMTGKVSAPTTAAPPNAAGQIAPVEIAGGTTAAVAFFARSPSVWMMTPHETAQ